MALTAIKTRPKLTIIIPYAPLLSFSGQTSPSSYSHTTKATTPTAPTTSLPPLTIYPSILKLNPCLQCHLLGLNCSFTTAAHVIPPRVQLHPSHSGPDEHCCVRCKRNREALCIKQIELAEEGKEGGYRADGDEERVLAEKVRGLFEEREMKGRWALPMAPLEHREGVNPGRWEWSVKEGEEEEALSGVGESSEETGGIVQ